MSRKLMVIFLSGVICLLGAIPVLAQGRFAIQFGTLQAYEEATGLKIKEFGESPMLKARVAAGELPPVEERISEEPVVIEPVEEKSSIDVLKAPEKNNGENNVVQPVEDFDMSEI